MSEKLNNVQQEIASILPELANGGHTLARLLGGAKRLIVHPTPFQASEKSYLGWDGKTAFAVRLFGGHGSYALQALAGAANGIIYNSEWVGKWAVNWHGAGMYQHGELAPQLEFTTFAEHNNDFNFTVDNNVNLEISVDPHSPSRKSSYQFNLLGGQVTDFDAVAVSRGGTRPVSFELTNSGLIVAKLAMRSGVEEFQFPAAITQVNIQE